MIAYTIFFISNSSQIWFNFLPISENIYLETDLSNWVEKTAPQNLSYI
jgi:hypothetical protein